MHLQGHGQLARAHKLVDSTEPLKEAGNEPTKDVIYQCQGTHSEPISIPD